MKRILVPVDGSDGANRAAAFAAKLAQGMGASLTLIHVYDLPLLGNSGLVQFSEEDLNNAMNQAADKAFAGAKAAIAKVAQAPECVSRAGNPTVEIVAYVKDNEVEMVVMGSRGVSPIEGIILGSVSERVLRGVACPVTIVK